MGNIVTVLDIGSSKTSVLIATLEKDQPPKVIGFASLPSKGVKKGMITNIDETMEVVASTITSAERMANVQIEDIFITVTGPNIVCQNEKGTISINSGEVTKQDVIRVIEYAKTQLTPLPTGMEFLHIIPNEFAIDSQGGIKYPIGMSGSKLEVEAHFILVPSSLIKNLSKIVQRLGVLDRGFIFSAWADTYSVMTDTEKELGATLLDIGGGTTDIVIFREGKVIYSGSVPLGGYNITADIAAGLHLSSLDDAEKIKKNLAEIYRRNESKKSIRKNQKEKNTDDDVLDISFLNIPGVDKISKRLLEEIIEARVIEILEFAEKSARAKGTTIVSPGGIILTGGTANLYNITKIINSVTKASARVAKPRGLQGMIDEISGPEYATIQGAVLYIKQEAEFEAQTEMGLSIVDKIRQWIKSVIK